jgi:microcystin-dependent protein
MPFQPFVGQIMIVPWNFAPRGWALCNGQILAITSNTPLFSLIGTFYGGNGTTTFALPNLQGRIGIHFGESPGTSAYSLGEAAGQENVTLTVGHLPAHTHSGLHATGRNGSTPSASGSSWAAAISNTPYSASASDGVMSPAAIAVAGGGQPHENRQPFLVLNYIIALQGIFPSRN